MSRQPKRTTRKCPYCGQTYKPPRHMRWTNHKCPAESAAQVRKLNAAAVASAKESGDAEKLARAEKIERHWNERFEREGR